MAGLLCPGSVPRWSTTRGSESLFGTRFEPGDWLLFGSESAGLPEAIRDALPVLQTVESYDEDRRDLPLPAQQARVLETQNRLADSILAHETLSRERSN